MRTTRITALGLLIMLTAGGPVALAASAHEPPPDPPPSGTTTLDLISPWTGGRSHTVDVGRKGISVGDQFYGTGAPVLAAATHQRVGTMDGVETIVGMAHDGTVLQVGSLRLAGGIVSIYGVVRHTDKPFSIPVVGGTRQYAGARGTLTLVREDAAHKETLFRLELAQPAG